MPIERTVKNRIDDINQRIILAAASCHRSHENIQLLAVSKGQTVETIREAFAAGISHFAENYWQEAEGKMNLLEDLPLHWHFIGAIQSNKVKALSSHFSWVQSISQKKTAEMLSQHRPEHLPRLQICVQVNLDQESSKSGLKPEEVQPLLAFISKLPNLQLRGLMAIPQIEANEALQYESFLRLTRLLHVCNQSLNLSLDTLSMGMSADFIPAIRAGSTMLRIGQAIFGERNNG